MQFPLSFTSFRYFSWYLILNYFTIIYNINIFYITWKHFIKKNEIHRNIDQKKSLKISKPLWILVQRRLDVSHFEYKLSHDREHSINKYFEMKNMRLLSDSYIINIFQKKSTHKEKVSSHKAIRLFCFYNY